MDSAELNRLIGLLESIENDTIDIKSAETVFLTFDQEALNPLKGVLANLHHFFDDEDIRNRDVHYKLMQYAELKKLISFLKSHKFEQANAVSFLDVSNASEST
ncbi:hypothetical protein [Alteromonas sp. H39]|uniref:hypothetical protein n=1 Tax=Alteromonas sp. H39 TaxID=3389876 RepID=UPI0039E04B6C